MGVATGSSFLVFSVFCANSLCPPLCFHGVFRNRRGILLACTGAIFSILVHSFTDFNLQIPSNAMLFFTFVGISLALPLPEKVHDSEA